jgi:phosphoribosyl 1,2-cyclic phosphate phosphodiesterase
LKVTFLGTGTSQGVPVIACECAVCKSTDARDKRLRVSVMLEQDGKVIVIDAGPDFRYQMLRAGVKHLDAIILTHEHKDHIAGLDDIRAFNYKQQSAIDIFAHTRVQDALKREFSYIFANFKYPGIPMLNLKDIDQLPFQVSGIEVLPIEVLHYKLPVLGFRIGDFTYITDAKTVSIKEREKIKGSKILVVNALQRESHISHFNLAEALTFADEMKAEKTYFTHISHRMGMHEDITKELPPNIEFAYDGLVMEL